jgi:hypothetical protein
MISAIQEVLAVIVTIVYILYVLFSGRNIILAILFLILFNPAGALIIFVIWDLIKGEIGPFGNNEK